MKIRIQYLFFTFLVFAGISVSSKEPALKPRVVVLTDVSTWETDDSESLVRLLAHIDLFEIEGLIFTTGWSLDKTRDDFFQLIHDAVNAYEKDLPNLMKRSGQKDFLKKESQQKIGYWPSAEYLRKQTLFGSKNRGFKFIGDDNDSPGSDLIIQLADENDDRPLWITVWGGGNTLAQAIWRIQQTRSTDELKAFLNKLRVYAITDQDRDQRTDFAISSHQWMRREFEKDLFFIWDECAWKFQNGTGKSNWEEYATHIQNHGNLGKVYPKYKYGVEGDTPAFLHILPNGLNNPNEPTQAGWGGYSAWGICEDNETYAFTNHKEPAYKICRKYEEHFYPATFNNFAARMDWANEGKGNRNPIAVINNNEGIEILKEKYRQGKTITLDASKSYDPDGDKLTFKWWIQPEAGTFSGNVDISNDNSDRALVKIPEASTGKTFHVICEITDNGVPNLTSYRRIIFEPVK
ncbi:MAG: DUF1593 domain-containing protein [Bacteroidetes bacterium]|nr:MAG: DUF1593 domain-containing protein [Bacteroidota bacterium]